MKKHSQSSDLRHRIQRQNRIAGLYNNLQIHPIHRVYNSKHNYTESSAKLLHTVYHLKKVFQNRVFKRSRLDNVYDFYLLYDKCHATDFDWEINHRRLFKKMGTSPFKILQDAHIHDGKNMKQAVIDDIGDGKLNYASKKQLHKIDIINRLYKFVFHGKRGHIRLAQKKDLINLLNTLIIFLKKLN